MKILAFDTALRACSVAVWIDGEIVASRFEERDRGHAEALVPMIEDVRGRAQIDYETLDRIAVTIGPGTFAGVRIGVAAARGLAVSLSVPLVGLTTLEVIAAAAQRHLKEDDTSLTAVFDARRGQVYTQSFDRMLKPLFPPRSQSPLELADSLPVGKPALVGDGCAVVLDALHQNDRDFRFMEEPVQPDAATAAKLAADRDVTEPNSGELRPLYLRPPDAKLPTPVPAPAQR